MSAKKLTVRLEQADRGAVRLPLPFDPTEAWGKKPRQFVKGSINGTPFQGSLGVREGRYFFPVGKELRELAEVSAGDTVKVVIEPAGAESAALPADLAAALDADARARAFFESLSPFYRNTYVEWITGAKKAETRTARVKKTVELLADGKKQR